MKCLICKEETHNRILCKKHIGVNNRLRYLSIHKCGSFRQKEGETEGVCKHYLLCEPIRRALKNEILMDNLAHVVCPYPLENLTKIIYSEFNEEEVRSNYAECLE